MTRHRAVWDRPRGTGQVERWGWESPVEPRKPMGNPNTIQAGWGWMERGPGRRLGLLARDKLSVPCPELSLGWERELCLYRRFPTCRTAPAREELELLQSPEEAPGWAEGWSSSAGRKGWHSWHCSPAQEKLWAELRAALQGLEEPQESWRETIARGCRDSTQGMASH